MKKKGEEKVGEEREREGEREREKKKKEEEEEEEENTCSKPWKIGEVVW